jgi:hypothetical protein
MNERELKARVDAALAMLIARDIFLLEHGTGERTVVAELASYMARLFRDYDVDVEYNRQGLDPRDSKVLTLGPECRGGGKKKVYPDIIVHRRGFLRGHNLLVVEVKRSLNAEPRTCDRAKIDAMKTQYGYRFGVLIELPSGPGAGSKEPQQAWR